MPPLPADSIHARACKLKCEKILTRPYKSLCQNQIIGNLEYWDKRHRYYARKLLQSSRGFQK